MKESIKVKLIKLLKTQRFAVIATQGEGELYTNLVAFLVEENLKHIYFPTLKNTKKYKNLSSNLKISLLVDNRVNKPKDIKKAITVTAVGKSYETQDIEVIKKFLLKHPYLKDFVNSKDCTMIKIKVEKYIIVDNFQNINILNF